jgi:glucose-1-phosphate thymidylyltransferase
MIKNSINKRKGIILAGGAGSRLWPASVPVTKQLLPVYDKPMIYYPLTTLMFAGIRNILIITTLKDLPRFQSLLGDGSQWGIKLSYEVQAKPEGIAQSFIIGADFIGDSPVALVLGDNIYYGSGFPKLVSNSSKINDGAVSFAYYVKKPKRYGVVEFSKKGTPISLHEKPAEFISNWALTGLYFYDNDVVDIARNIKPSARGELEITSINQIYLERNKLHVEKMSRGYAWLDAGTHSSLLEASQFIYSIEKRQGLKIGCPEEVAYRMNFITESNLNEIIEKCPQAEYGDYLKNVLGFKND